MARTNAEGDDLILDQQLHRFLKRLLHVVHANDASVGTPQRGRPPGREYVAALAALRQAVDELDTVPVRGTTADVPAAAHDLVALVRKLKARTKRK